MVGILDWLSQPAVAGADTNRLGLIGAGLHDIGNTIGGQPTNDAASLMAQAKSNAARQAINAKLKAAYATGDMNQVRQALLDADAAGEDISHITSAMSFGQPKIQDIGGAGYSIPTFGDGPPQKIIDAVPKAPPGYTFGAGNKSLSFIPGGPADPRFAGALAGAKRKPAAAKATAAPKAPWEMY